MERRNREAVVFDPNVPVEVRLRWTDGKLINGVYGNDRLMFTTTDDRVLFLDADVGRQIHEMRAQPNEPIMICKQRASGRGAPVYWKIWRAEQSQPAALPDETALARDLRHSLNVKAGTSPHGVLVIEKDAPRAAAAPAPPPPARPATPPPPVMPHANGNGNNGKTPMKATYGAAMQEFLLMAGRATREAERVLGAEGGSVRFDSRDVAALATTLLIQASKDGFLTWKPGEVA